MKQLTDSEIEAIDSLEWYQTIQVGEGVSTPGETGEAEQRKLEMMNLPEDLSGKSVLDVGCNEGFFSFEAEKRGASRVLAIEKSVAAKEKFELIKSILQSKVELMFTDLLELDPSKLGKFDIVIFLSVFHHLRYPFMSIDRIFELTGEYAVMEFVEAVPVDGSDQSALVRKLSKKKGHLHMLPTRQFTLEMLSRAGFSKIEVLGTHRDHKIGPERQMSGYSERRVLLKAYR